MSYIEAVTGSVFEYNSRIFDNEWSPNDDLVSEFFQNSTQREDIYKAIHIDQSFKVPVFEYGSDSVDKGYQYSNLVDFSYYYNYMIKENFPTIVMAGEYDMKDGAAGQVYWMKENLDIDQHFWDQDRTIYYYDDTNVGGQYRQEGNFTFITVPKSGHFMPADNYDAAKAFLDDYVKYGELRCKAGDEKCHVRAQMCNYMNDCSGNGKCGPSGTCICDSLYKGADCSFKAVTCEECQIKT